MLLGQFRQHLGAERPARGVRGAVGHQAPDHTELLGEVGRGAELAGGVGGGVPGAGQVERDVLRGDRALDLPPVGRVRRKPVHIEDEVHRPDCAGVKVQVQEHEGVEHIGAARRRGLDGEHTVQVLQHAAGLVQPHDVQHAVQEVGVPAGGLVREGAPLLEQVAVDQDVEPRKGALEAPCAPQAARRGQHGYPTPRLGMADERAGIRCLGLADVAGAPPCRDVTLVAHAGVEPLDPAALPQQGQVLQEVGRARRVSGMPAIGLGQGGARRRQRVQGLVEHLVVGDGARRLAEPGPDVGARGPEAGMEEYQRWSASLATVGAKVEDLPSTRPLVAPG